MRFRKLLVPVLTLWTGAVLAAGVDPLAADIDARDALRFAALMKDGAVPTADVLQRDYLDGAGPGVKIFTPGRIRDARHLAAVVAAKPDTYRYAIRNCLPQLPAATACRNCRRCAATCARSISHSRACCRNVRCPPSTSSSAPAIRAVRPATTGRCSAWK